ncbi:MAG: hypothetical protein KBD55_00590 [Candidatus Pacebacteria bacterium]|jgi:hypothetical protein|nr:hypothetical protein [Candidatus Paceibacterota bacterium]
MTEANSSIWWSVFSFIRFHTNIEIGEGTLLSDIKRYPAGLVMLCEHHYGIELNIDKPMSEITVGRLIRAILQAQVSKARERASQAASEA